MKSLKFFFEKPLFIWVMICAIYFAVYWVHFGVQPITPEEQNQISIIDQFSQTTFPPKVDVLRKHANIGHAGYYALFSRVYLVFKGDVDRLRLLCLALALAALFMFVQLGLQFTYQNRVNPLWVSIALLILAINPYELNSAFFLNHWGLFLFLTFTGFYFFKRDNIAFSAFCLSLATLVDWAAILLALAFILTRVIENESRILRPERMLTMFFPILIGMLPFFEQEFRGNWLVSWNEKSLIRPDSFFYNIALLPIYSVFFGWAWGIRARTRSQFLGIILVLIGIPFFFMYPIQSEPSLGMIHRLANEVSTTYMNLILFVPWLFGMFLFSQIFFMSLRDRSRPLRYFIVFFYLAQPFVFLYGDAQFLLVLPFILLLSLSEAFVGEEGKLA